MPLPGNETAFDRDLTERLRSDEFHSAFVLAQGDIAAVDRIMRSLAEARRALGRTVADLANSSGVEESVVHSLLTGHEPPRLAEVTALARALGMELVLQPRQRTARELP